jgi:ABC-2 type transport system ATP-binding protein
MNTVLFADSVGKRFGRTTVLRAATITIGDGITVLVGRNGSGKTTLVRILMGLTEADSGIIHFDQHYLERPRWSWMARRGLAYLPADGFLPIRDRVSAVLRTVSANESDYQHAVKRSNLSGLCEKRVHELSTGERRLTELAWLTLRRPRVVIADEPLRTLSPLNRGETMQRFRDLAQNGTAILVTGHETRELLDHADTVQWLDGGYIRQLGSPDQAKQDEVFVNSYFGRPPAR